MGQKLGEVFVEFGIKGAEKMKDFSKDIASLPLNILSTVAAFTGLSLTFAGLTDDMINMTGGLRDFHSQTGLATEAMDKWDQIARRVGLSNGTVESSFNALVSGIAKIKIGMGDEKMIMAFGQMGIRDFMTAGPDRLIDEMLQKFNQSKSPAARQKFMQWMTMTGVSPQMARAFESYPQGIRGMNQMYTPDTQREIAEFVKALSELTDTVRREWVPIFKELVPYLKEIVTGFAGIAEFFLHTKIDPAKSAWNLGRRTREWMDQVVAGEGIGAIPNRVFMPGMLGPQGGPRISVNQHFYGDVDKFDIDEGALDLKRTLTHTMRMLGKGGQ